MTNRKASGMVVSNAGGKDFEPDPVIPAETMIEARILGFAHIGQHEKDLYGSDGKPTGDTEIQEQAIIMFELAEEEYDVERGGEDNKHMVPRIFTKFLKWSSHEKSTLFGIAKNANKDSAWIEDKKGQVDPVEFLGCALNVEMGTNKDGDKNNIKKTSAIAEKYKKGVRELQGTPFMFSVDHGAFAGTSIADVPPWILNLAMDKAVNADEFGMAAEIEEQQELNEKAKDDAKSGKLEGDDKPAKESAKKEPKEEKAEDKPAASGSRRSRRGQKAEEKKVDYSNHTLEQLEDVLAENGWDDDKFDEVGAANESDDDYQAALLEACNAL